MAVNLANSFVDLGYSVDMVLAHWSGAYINKLDPNIRRFDLGCKQLWRSPPRLIHYLREHQPDVLISALHYPCEIAIVAKYLSGAKTRVIVSERNTLSVEAARLPQLTAKLTPLSSRLLYPFADQITAISKGVAEDLAKTAKISPSKIAMIYNPVFEANFDPNPIKAADHPWLNDPDIPVVLGIGRLMEQKDFKTFLKAAKIISQSRSVRFLILGEGEKRPDLEHYILRNNLTETVQLVGFVDEPFRYLKAASAFVLSSQWEGFGNVLVEAMIMGVPVISTDCPHGPREILNGGEFGHLVPVEDSPAIARAIFQVLDGDRRLPTREWLSQFTQEHVVSKYLSLL